jgi:hypothetical protein
MRDTPHALLRQRGIGQRRMTTGVIEDTGDTSIEREAEADGETTQAAVRLVSMKEGGGIVVIEIVQRDFGNQLPHVGVLGGMLQPLQQHLQQLPWPFQLCSSSFATKDLSHRRNWASRSEFELY